MTFQELLKQDLDTFINTDEFAEMHVINGVEIAAVVNKYTQAKSSSESKTFPILHGDFVEVCFKTSDFIAAKERLPKHGDRIKVDGRMYSVENCENEHGITIIILNAYRQSLTKAASKIGRSEDYD